MNKYPYPFLIFFLLTSFQILAQPIPCEPDPAYADSLAGVYPGPWHPVDYPDGGLKDTACINHEFTLQLTAVVRDTLNYSGVKLKLNHLKIIENGVLNMPAGLDYSCNPPNCFFEANTLGCMVISGVPTSENDIGNYDLKLHAEIVALDSFLFIVDTLPELLIPGSHYYLYLDEENSGSCQGSNVRPVIAESGRLVLLQNPVREGLPFRVQMKNSDEWILEVLDENGRKIARQTGRGSLENGLISWPGTQIEAGMYLARLKQGNWQSIEKFIIIAD